jgi:Transposase DDE domain
MEPLLSQIGGKIDRFMADGAYDGKPAYQTILQHSSTANVVIPPRSTAVASGDTGPPGQRDKHIAAIARNGRLKWQAATGYGKRALIETAIGRYKGLIGSRLRARSFAAQQTEVAIGCIVLNRMLACARPEPVRHQVRQA